MNGKSKVAIIDDEVDMRESVTQWLQLSGFEPVAFESAELALKTLAPDFDGSAYQNFIDPTLIDWKQAYYAENFGRLVEVKRTYDPRNVFHFPQSIPVQA